MKVVYVIDSLAGGGAERSLVEMVPHLVASGVELTIALFHDRGDLTVQATSGGADVVHVGGDGMPGHVRSLRQVLRSARPDLVHTTLFDSDIAGRLAARSAGIVVTGSLVNIHYGPESRQPGVAAWKQRLVQLADAGTARVTPRLHAVSTWVADVMAERLRYPRDRIVVIPRGRDPVRLGRRTPERRAAARAALGVADEEQVILAVGRLEHQKGFDRLLEAMPDVRASHPRAVLRIAGKDGRDSAVLRSSAASHGLDPDAVFLGERTDVPELLCAADLFVLASRREGMPGALLEAMALEVPVLAADLPVVRELLGTDADVVADGRAWAPAISEALAVGPSGPTWRARFEKEFTTEAQAVRLAEFWRASG